MPKTTFLPVWNHQNVISRKIGVAIKWSNINKESSLNFTFWKFLEHSAFDLWTSFLLLFGKSTQSSRRIWLFSKITISSRSFLTENYESLLHHFPRKIFKFDKMSHSVQKSSKTVFTVKSTFLLKSCFLGNFWTRSRFVVLFHSAVCRHLFVKISWNQRFYKS